MEGEERSGATLTASGGGSTKVADMAVVFERLAASRLRRRDCRTQRMMTTTTTTRMAQPATTAVMVAVLTALLQPSLSPSSVTVNVTICRVC